MSVTDDIRDIVARVSKRPLSEIAPKSRLTEDLGIRSLQRVELAIMLEQKLGREVPDALVMVAKTVADLETKLGS